MALKVWIMCKDGSAYTVNQAYSQVKIFCAARETAAVLGSADYTGRYKGIKLRILLRKIQMFGSLPEGCRSRDDIYQIIISKPLL